MKAFLFILCFLPSTVYASDLTDMQIKKEVTWQILNVMDYGQTRYISDSCHHTVHRETNSLIGRCPNMNSVNNYFISYAVSHYFVTRFLDKDRDLWLNVSIVITFTNVMRNSYLGIKIDF